MTLKIIDAMQYVLDNPKHFFKTGKPNELELAFWVWSDAALSDCRDVIVHHDGAIWVVAGSTNWLMDKEVKTSDLFVRVVPLPVGGPNSMRGEILLNVFCTEVLALVNGVRIFEKAAHTVRPVLDGVFRRWPGLEAAIAFRL